MRSAALAAVLRQLADEDYLHGWRDELYAVTRVYGEPPLFHLERAAARARCADIPQWKCRPW